MSSLREHVAKVADKHAKALAVLREIVGTLETFRPGPGQPDPRKGR